VGRREFSFVKEFIEPAEGLVNLVGPVQLGPK
jgi:hypothetical protein